MTVDRQPHLGAEPGPWRPPSSRERLGILNQTRTMRGRRLVQPGPGQPFRRHLPLSSSTDYTVWFVNPRETSIWAARSIRAWRIFRNLPTSSTCSARNEDLPGVAADAVAAGPGPSGPSWGSGRRGRRGGPPGRAFGRDGSMSEDRARPLRRRAPPGRLRHRGHQLPAAVPVRAPPPVVDEGVDERPGRTTAAVEGIAGAGGTVRPPPYGR